MRIIAGTHRGRLLRGPQGRDTTRPITDRVKENLFNILGQNFAGMVVADLFAGTGSLGIEALSRGAQHVVFVEKDGKAIAALKDNLADFGLTDRSLVLRQDFLMRPIPRSPAGPLDVVFLDPPYKLTETDAERVWLKLCQAVDQSLFASDAVIVWRHEKHQRVQLPEAAAAGLKIDQERQYGSQTLTFIVLTQDAMSSDECRMSNEGL
ncbi:MAG: Ribosomal RNA small subunit methyltransferase D [Phycisphaerae bacterium]|nr:Ribosomal RNA small subunit methyltransferase D [Phycisphaerae bacterium]